MSRTIVETPLTVCYKAEVTSIIRGHHVYKKVCDATIGEMLRMIEKKQKNMKNTLLVCTEYILVGPIRTEISKFMLPFHQSRFREQNKSIDNWKTTTRNWTCHSGKVNFHNKQ